MTEPTSTAPLPYTDTVVCRRCNKLEALHKDTAGRPTCDDGIMNDSSVAYTGGTVKLTPCLRCAKPLQRHRLDGPYRVCDDGADADSIAVYPLPVRVTAPPILPTVTDTTNRDGYNRFHQAISDEYGRTLQWLEEAINLGNGAFGHFSSPSWNHKHFLAARAALRKITL